MDLDTLAKLGEFVGGIFVVVSIVYLAHEVRQNTSSLRAENYARVLDRMSTLQSKLSTDPALNRLVTVGAQDPWALTRSERVRFSWAMYELVGAAEFMFHQGRDGGLPDAVWRRWEATMAWWLSHPGIRAWWAAKPTPMSADFQVYADRIVRVHRPDPEVEGRWLGFVAGPAAPAPPAAFPGGAGA